MILPAVDQARRAYTLLSEAMTTGAKEGVTGLAWYIVLKSLTLATGETIEQRFSPADRAQLDEAAWAMLPKLRDKIVVREVPP